MRQSLMLYPPLKSDPGLSASEAFPKVSEACLSALAAAQVSELMLCALRHLQVGGAIGRFWEAVCLLLIMFFYIVHCGKHVGFSKLSISLKNDLSKTVNMFLVILSHLKN